MPRTPEALWAAWRAGDAGAFAVLYDRVSPPLFALCLALTARSAVTAEDLFQEAFRRAILAADRFRPTGDLEAWLATIVRHTHVDLLRQAARRAPVTTPESGSEPGILRVDLLDYLNRLSAELREPVILHHLQGLSIQEVAEKLGISPATVKRRLAEGFKLLSQWKGS